MIEDTEINEFRVKPLNPDMIVSSENNETAYSLESVPHGICVIKEEAMISKIPVANTTLGFECDTECDFLPNVLTTYNADGSENAVYNYGDHAPDEENYQKECRFKPGDKVLCLMFKNYNAVFPGIVVGPLSEEYLRNYYDSDEEMQIGYSSADEAVENWLDWDSVIVRPLARLRNGLDEMGDTVMVNRVYIFPYKKFEI